MKNGFDVGLMYPTAIMLAFEERCKKLTASQKIEELVFQSRAHTPFYRFVAHGESIEALEFEYDCPGGVAYMIRLAGEGMALSPETILKAAVCVNETVGTGRGGSFEEWLAIGGVGDGTNASEV